MFSLFRRTRSASTMPRRASRSFKPSLEVLEDRSLMSVTLLNDSFNTDNGGAGALNFSQFANWEVTRGTVDLIGAPSFFDYYPGNGLYVDLDGSSNEGGRLESRTVFTLDPGVYELRFDLGNDPGFPGDVNTAVVSLGSVYCESFSREGYAPGQGPSPNVPLETVVRQITVASPTTGKLVFDQAGGDNGGLIIDNVRLSRLDQPPITVSIDVKPGSASNPLNLASEGVIPVTLFDTNTLDVSQVDVNSLLFAGAHVAHAALQDVNHDGKLDLVLQFRTQDTNLSRFRFHRFDILVLS